MELTEKQITQQITDMLERVGALVIPTHGPIWNKIPARRGVADLLVCWHGNFVAIEVKAAKGKPPEDQKQFLSDVEHRGGIAILAYSVEDVAGRLGLQVKL